MFDALIAIGVNFLRSPAPLVTTLVLLLLLTSPLALNMRTGVSAKLLPDIYWNSTNRMFRVDNTDHVWSVRIRDRVNIKCPKYDPVQVFDPNQVEYSEIHNVPRWGYENCMLTPSAKIVGVCRTPFHESVITVVFREYTPSPGGLEFTPGRSYYFISTSNGTQSGLSNRQDGLCSSKNMRMKFEIHAFEEDATVEENDSNPTNNDLPPTPAIQKPTTTTTDNTKFVYLPTTSERLEQRENSFERNIGDRNTNSGELGGVIKNSSPNLLTRPNLELATTTTTFWYEIHSEHPDDVYANYPKVNNRDKFNNNNVNKDRIRGETGDNINSDSELSNSKDKSGASSNFVFRSNLFLSLLLLLTFMIFNILRIAR